MTTLPNETLQQEFFEITTGLLLGDGNLQKPKTCLYYRLRFSQLEIRQDYVQALFNKYKWGLENSTKPLINQLKPRKYNYITPKHKLSRFSYNFETRISSAFNKHAKIFYASDASKKKLSEHMEQFKNLLTPTALAYWYMDDGTWPNKKANSFILCTHAYEFEKVTYLSEILNERYNLKTSVAKNKNQPIIRISSQSKGDFKKIIEHIIYQFPSMANKFPFKE